LAQGEKFVLMRLDEDQNRTFFTFNGVHLINKKIKKISYVSNELLKDRKTRAMVVVEEIGTNKSRKILN
jgi:hypothetical protein